MVVLATLVADARQSLTDSRQALLAATGRDAYTSRPGASVMITAENFWFWFGGIWLAVGLLFAGVGGGIAYNRAGVERRLAASGVATDGVVLVKELDARDGGDNYNVTFRFAGPQGETVRGSAELDAETWNGLVERGPISVVFLPDQPGTYRVPGQTDDAVVLGIVFPLVGVALALVGGFVVANAVRMRRIRGALLQRGATASATVVDVAPGNLRINGVPQMVLRYRFHDSSGKAHDGKVQLAPDEAQRWSVGAAGRVRYDSRNPRSHVWTGQR